MIPPGEWPRLSPRQHQVLCLLRMGMQTKEIADRLHIGNRTAKFHIANIFTRFGVYGCGARMELLRKVGFDEEGFRKETCL